MAEKARVRQASPAGPPPDKARVRQASPAGPPPAWSVACAGLQLDWTKSRPGGARPPRPGWFFLSFAGGALHLDWTKLRPGGARPPLPSWYSLCSWREADIQDRMQLDSIRSDPGLSVKEVKEADAFDFERNSCLREIRRRRVLRVELGPRVGDHRFERARPANAMRRWDFGDHRITGSVGEDQVDVRVGFERVPDQLRRDDEYGGLGRFDAVDLRQLGGRCRDAEVGHGRRCRGRQVDKSRVVVCPRLHRPALLPARTIGFGRIADAGYRTRAGTRQNGLRAGAFARGAGCQRRRQNEHGHMPR